jgi:NADH-quinone oxidoreductase subunit D
MTPTPGNDRFIVPIGPQHPALKEPGHFEFTLDDEVVTGASLRLGYAHRGIEKLVESRNWTQSLYVLERICGICSHIHAFAYCLAVEHLAGVSAPLRAQTIRVVTAELERLHSHLLWLGVTAHQAGFDTMFMYSWRDREVIMNILESLSGNRVHYSVNLLGGVKVDLTAELIALIVQGIDQLEARAKHYLDLVQTDSMFRRRTRGIGVMTREQAEACGVVGPTARASGVARDLRRDVPYAAYVDHALNVVTDEAGDLEARIVVRVKELVESCGLIRRLINALPEGELTARMPRRIPEGEAMMRVEAPRGELFYFVRSTGSDRPDRVKVRTPSLPNIASVPLTAIGAQLADIPVLLAGVDPCFSCNDRMVLLADGRGRDQPARTWTWEQLRRYGIEHYR